jgi:hypothetical protein
MIWIRFSIRNTLSKRKRNILQFLIDQPSGQVFSPLQRCPHPNLNRTPDHFKFRCFSPLATLMAVVRGTKSFHPGSIFQVAKLMSYALVEAKCNFFIFSLCGHFICTRNLIMTKQFKCT